MMSAWEFQALEAVSQLGKDPEEFRQTLASLGVQGVKKSITCCPIANYLTLKLKQYPEAGWFTFFRNNDSFGLFTTFIRNFDEGRYPELECNYEKALQLRNFFFWR
jgi:hypothetical protein